MVASMTSTRDQGSRGASAPLTLTARSPEDLLALAPVVLGFLPADSVVMLTFGASEPFHARLDLPGPGHGAGEVAEVVDLLITPARRHGVQRVVLLIYSADRGLVQQVWQGLRCGFDEAGIGVVDALRVAEERWYPLCGRDDRARESGVSFDISSHPFLVQAIVDGRVTHGSRAALAATIAPEDEAVARLSALTAVCDQADDLLVEGSWIESTLTRQLSDGSLPDDRELARILVGVATLGLRDAAWSTLTRELAREAVAWWTHALTRCPDGLAAGPAALLAWAAWLHGNGALAWCAVDRCESAEPGYGLGRIVADLLERAQPPSSWSGELDWRSGLEDVPRAG
jgi:hypothetical protein